ncbi:Sterol 24-C-methyltransferase erg6 [Cladobotryum mycophilum]|uniref:Sterol 24-C-methyltransferase erg6 n=1 Tax=Cladobotryum mycophilum TaxID=491253 RepID=A0ABR0SI68_9HYPO
MEPVYQEHLRGAAFSNAFHGNSVAANSDITAMRKKDPEAYRATFSSMPGACPFISFVFHLDSHSPMLQFGMRTTLLKKPGHRNEHNVLDVGCGTGRPAYEVACLTSANIVGLSNNDYQIQRGKRYTATKGFHDPVACEKGCFIQIRLEPKYFNASYSIEGTSYASILEGVYTKNFKTLKPGGIVVVYELIMKDACNDGDSEHHEFRYSIEKIIGVIDILKTSDEITALKAAGSFLDPSSPKCAYYAIGSASHYLNK